MNDKVPKQWLDKAMEDLIVARLVLEEDHTAHACFLSQQCIEKSLKAYLVARSNDYPRIHNLVDLLGLCRRIDSSFAQFHSQCAVIDEYYVPTRYPSGIAGMGPLGFPSDSEATEAITAAETIFEFVTQQLG